ncbi:MAG: hypothetical protein H8D47_02155 [Planctomycetes bacterium]|nr:hypothetical protein [Planctomycetota bacterium]
MKKRKYKIFGCLLLIGAITVSFGITLADADAGFGKTITTAKMANMFGGGFVCPDKDCDTESGSCPGGDTGCPDMRTNDCYDCKSGNGKICGDSQPEWGWMCVPRDPEDCNDGSVRSCCDGVCEMFNAHGDPPIGSCGTRPDCDS